MNSRYGLSYRAILKSSSCGYRDGDFYKNKLYMYNIVLVEGLTEDYLNETDL